MKYTPEELDEVLNSLPSDGSLFAPQDFFTPYFEKCLIYLEAKGCVYLEKSSNKGIAGAGLTENGIILSAEGGFVERKRIEQQEKEEARQLELDKWKLELKQRTKDRRIQIWIPILCVILGAILALVVQNFIFPAN